MFEGIPGNTIFWRKMSRDGKIVGAMCPTVREGGNWLKASPSTWGIPEC